MHGTESVEPKTVDYFLPKGLQHSGSLSNGVTRTEHTIQGEDEIMDL